jgi:hypothetical protein
MTPKESISGCSSSSGLTYKTTTTFVYFLQPARRTNNAKATVLELGVCAAIDEVASGKFYGAKHPNFAFPETESAWLTSNRQSRSQGEKICLK